MARRILLHICCGPCSIYPVRRLQEQGFEVTSLYYNPNIHPAQEYIAPGRRLVDAVDVLNANDRFKRH